MPLSDVLILAALATFGSVLIPAIYIALILLTAYAYQEDKRIRERAKSRRG